MIPPLIRVALREPGLLAEHAQGYSQLARHEFLAWRGRLRRRLLWWALTVLFAMAALILTGTALIAWSVTGVTHGLLWGVPLLPWVAAALTALRAVRLDASDEHEGRLWDQIDADIQLLKELP